MLWMRQFRRSPPSSARCCATFRCPSSTEATTWTIVCLRGRLYRS